MIRSNQTVFWRFKGNAVFKVSLARRIKGIPDLIQFSLEENHFDLCVTVKISEIDWYTSTQSSKDFP